MKISDTAFYFLGANPHDSRSEIHKLVDSATFLKNEQECRNAERNLLQSNKRIEHEVAWLPGVPPEIAKKLIQNAQEGQFSRKYASQGHEVLIPVLAACNLLSWAAQNIHFNKPETVNIEQLDGIFRTAAELYDSIKIEEELELINSDRAKAGFAMLTDAIQLADFVENQRKELRASINKLLCNFDEADEITWLSNKIEEIDDNAPLPSLLEELLSEYEIRKKDTYTQLENKILGSIGRLRIELASTAENTVPHVSSVKLENLKKLIHSWRKIIYPILLSYKNKGLSLKSAETVIGDIREFYIQAVEEYENEYIFPTLCEAISFVVDTVPKFSNPVKNDLLFLRGRFKDSRLLKKIKAICQDYENIPSSQDDIILSFNKLKNSISAEIVEQLGENSSDWLCLLYIKYGVSLANDYGDYENAIEIFQEAQNIAKSSDIRKLLDNNIKRIDENKKYIHRKKIENDEKEREHDKKVLSAKKQNRRTNIFTAFVCAIIAILCGLALYHVNSSSYEWSHILQLTIRQKLNYLKHNPSSEHKENLTELIIQQIVDLSPNQTHPYICEGIIDAETAFGILTSNPTHHKLEIFSSLYPESSPSYDKRTQKIKAQIAEETWKKFNKPYVLEEVESFMSTYEDVINLEKIQKQVCSSIIVSDDARYIASFLDLVESTTLRKKLLDRIRDIEKKDWIKKSPHLETLSELVEYQESMTSEEVKNLVEKKIIELEKKIWYKNYASSTSEAELLRAKESFKSSEVRKLVDKRLEELYASFEFAQKKNTIEAYQRLIRLSKNPEEQEKARKRIIDLEVKDIARGRHSELPPQHGNATRYTRTGVAEIKIKNDTDYTITVMYSGKDSEKLSIPAHGSKTVRISSGVYAIAVTTAQSNVIPFYGNETIESGEYHVTYYISSSPSYHKHSYPSWY